MLGAVSNAPFLSRVAILVPSHVGRFLAEYRNAEMSRMLSNVDQFSGTISRAKTGQYSSALGLPISLDDFDQCRFGRCFLGFLLSIGHDFMSRAYFTVNLTQVKFVLGASNSKQSVEILFINRTLIRPIRPVSRLGRIVFTDVLRRKARVHKVLRQYVDGFSFNFSLSGSLVKKSS
jgi:hypothetical protein